MDNTGQVRCVICNNPTRRRKEDHRYYVHKDNDGDRCAASGFTRERALQWQRTFIDRNHTDYRMEVFDNTDSIGFHTCHEGDGHRFEMWLELAGTQVRQLIAELAEIADQRGL